MGFTPLWMNDLQPASWRGVPFAVKDISHRAGRRVAVHEYPFRDMPWVEDMGLGLEEYAIRGFVNGDDVAAQAVAIRKACTTPGPGELVHPRFGSLTVSIVASSFKEDSEAGNVFEFQLVFLVTQTESSTTLWPVAKTSTLDAITTKSLDASGAMQGDFLSRAGDALKAGQAAVKEVVSTAQGYVGEINRAVGDARGALGAVQGLATSVGVPASAFGRFNKVLNSVQGVVTGASSNLALVTRVDNGVSHALAGATRARDVVNGLAQKATNLAGAL